MAFIPGLLQTAEFTRSGARPTSRPARDWAPDKAADGREGRQRMLRRPGGPPTS